MNVEKFFETLSKILSEKEGVIITIKNLKKVGGKDGKTWLHNYRGH